MIKFIVLCTKIIIAAIAALLVTSCKYDIDLDNGIDGSGNVISEKRNVTEDFTKVSVNRGIEVIIEQSDKVEIEVDADDNIIKHISTNVENGTLLISCDEDIDSAEKETVRIKMPNIDSIETSSGSSISTQNTLKGNLISVKSSSGSEIDASLEYDNIISEATSGSNLSISGKALSLKTHSSSVSEINAENLLANEITSESTSGSSTTIHPLVNLNAKASSGASIDYSGNPKKIRKEETSGGSVSGN